MTALEEFFALVDEKFPENLVTKIKPEDIRLSIKALALKLYTDPEVASTILDSLNLRLRRTTIDAGFSAITDDEVQFDGSTWVKEVGSISPGDPGYGGVLLSGPTGFRFRRRFEGPVRPEWFGAIHYPVIYMKGTNEAPLGYYADAAFTIPVVDSSAAYNACFTYANALAGSIRSVEAPSGFAFISNVLIPEALDFSGQGTGLQSVRQCTTFVQSFGTNLDVFRVIPHEFAGRYWWYGSIRKFSIKGERTNNSSGWGIAFRDSLNNPVKPQDTTLISDIMIRGMVQGGIEFPDGGLPVHLHRTNFLWNNGPGILISSTAKSTGLLQHFDLFGVSGDGNNGGLVRIEKQTASSLIVINNIKSENRINPYYGNAKMQDNTVVIGNSDGLVLSIVGGRHDCSVPDGSLFKKPGDFIFLESDANNSQISWNGISMRIRETDTGTDPRILYKANGTVAISYQMANGKFPQINVQGGDGLAENFGVGDKGFQAKGETPFLGFFETDAPTDRKSFIITHSGGNAQFRTVSDAGVSTIISEIVRGGAAGIASLWRMVLNIFRITDTTPTLEFEETDQTADNQFWQIRASSANLQITLKDAAGSLKTGVFFRRSGNTPTGMVVGQKLVLIGNSGDGSTVPSLVANTSTQSVSGSSAYKTANSSATTINALTGGDVGQVLMIIANDDNTTLRHNLDGTAGNIWLQSLRNYKMKVGQVILLERDTTYWREVGGLSLSGYQNGTAAPSLNAVLIGEEFYDSTNKTFWKAIDVGNGSADWKQITN
ncbi:hypothetical protein [Larkinella sp. C7]|uniref:hypothetical protein n=1 Tax=Larkinella sp. C7 TaxID=2576607 RepID=UPI00111115CC|nr:hypothetical protein [Larkinella sp. C7]